MLTGSIRHIACGILLSPLVAVSANAQVSAPPARIEQGLEDAVNWKWWVDVSDEKEWGVVLPGAERSKPGEGSEKTSAPVVRPDSYEVKRGDALSKIARKFGMTGPQLKEVNGLSSDLIKIGQTLKIPTIEELNAMAPPPTPEAATSEEDADDADSEEEPSKELPVEVRFSRETGPFSYSRSSIGRTSPPGRLTAIPVRCLRRRSSSTAACIARSKRTIRYSKRRSTRSGSHTPATCSGRRIFNLSRHLELRSVGMERLGTRWHRCRLMRSQPRRTWPTGRRGSLWRSVSIVLRDFCAR